MRKQCEHLSCLRMKTQTPESRSSGEENTHAQVHSHAQSCPSHIVTHQSTPACTLACVHISRPLSGIVSSNRKHSCSVHIASAIQLPAAIDVLTILCIEVICLLHQADNLHHVLVFISIQDLHAHAIFADVTHQRWPRITAGTTASCHAFHRSSCCDSFLCSHEQKAGNIRSPLPLLTPPHGMRCQDGVRFHQSAGHEAMSWR